MYYIFALKHVPLLSISYTWKSGGIKNFNNFPMVPELTRSRVGAVWLHSSTYALQPSSIHLISALWQLQKVSLRKESRPKVVLSVFTSPPQALCWSKMGSSLQQTLAAFPVARHTTFHGLLLPVIFPKHILATSPSLQHSSVFYRALHRPIPGDFTSLISPLFGTPGSRHKTTYSLSFLGYCTWCSLSWRYCSTIAHPSSQTNFFLTPQLI
jgi:hypothetical protein